MVDLLSLPTMTHAESLQLAQRIADGQVLTADEAYHLASTPEQDVMALLPGADWLRRHFRGNKAHTCTILNAKSGKCSEDCGFCSQSHVAHTDSPVYGLMSAERMQEDAHAAMRSGVDRFAVVTSGRGLPKAEVRKVAEAFSVLPRNSGTQFCSSLGILAREELQVLFDGGISRFHHNLETSRSYFPTICTSHTYDARVQTVRDAKAVGMSVCSGGLFGIGESDAQVAEMALELRDLDVDSIPVNFLMAIPGTSMEHQPPISALRCLKIIALFRFIHPQAEILVCGGREGRLGELHPLIFQAGASGLMTGNYLTREGRTVAKDKIMLDALGMEHDLHG